MTDSTLGMLRAQEARAQASRMDRAEKQRFLRKHGWKRAFSTGTERWLSRDGASRTLSGAVAEQLFRDMSEDQWQP
jgi:hypothetical protein